MTTKPETRKTEVLFVDPEVDDLTTVLRGLRPDVEAVVLSADEPPARQIAAALEDKANLAAVHLMAHGAPGRVIFSGGVWSAGTLEWDASELAAIGGALGDTGELRLWSCNTAAGATGAAFVEALARTTGADVAASAERVGAASLGGGWELTARAARPAPEPPLTAAGVEAYAGVLAAGRITVSGPIPDGETTGEVHYVVVDKATNAVLGRFFLPDASHKMRAFRLLVDVASLADAYDVGVLGPDGRFDPSNFTVEAPPRGAVGAAA